VPSKDKRALIADPTRTPACEPADARPAAPRQDGTRVALDDALDALLRFGAALLRSGATAYRTRESMILIARALGHDALSVGFTTGSITATLRRSTDHATMIREIEPHGVNARRIGALQQLAETVGPGTTPRDIAAKITAIEAAPPRFSHVETAAAGVACGAFAFLNDGGLPEVITAAIASGIGQWLRVSLMRRGLNHHGVIALCAVVAAGLYAFMTLPLTRLGVTTWHHPAGLISATLFLIPGFPLVAALLDLLEHEAVTAVTRFASAVTILLAASLGLSLVIAAAGLDVVSQPPLAIAMPAKLLLRAVASFAGGCGFAMLFNSSGRAVLAIGLLALGANELRLSLHDAGMSLALATLLAATAVGLVASLLHRRLHEPRIAITVPSIIIMTPGLYAFKMIVLFGQGRVPEALEAASLFAFVIGAMGAGLASARFLSEGWRFADPPELRPQAGDSSDVAGAARPRNRSSIR